MDMTEFLAAEWIAALGCTEPAAVAWAASMAAAQGEGAIRQVRLVCDPRTYKNCYAVGIPNSGRATGILWALALGVGLPEGLGLRCFEAITETVLGAAEALLSSENVQVDVDSRQTCLYVDVTVQRDHGTGRAVLHREHGHLARLEKDGDLVGGAESQPRKADAVPVRQAVADLSMGDLMALARILTAEDRERLREGAAMNLAMARHGLSILPPGFLAAEDPAASPDPSSLVSAGVYARMCGEPNPVMTLAGSGNKGITLAVPVTLRGRRNGCSGALIEEGLAFGCLMTSAATWHLGTLSAMCGAANAAGIGIASALVFMEGGGEREVALAISSMVGNLAGMICDGAKIGCAMKTQTGVEAAYRAARLAMAGIGIPVTDGIVGGDGEASLVNLGRLAQRGMAGADAEILGIMQGKLGRT